MTLQELLPQGFGDKESAGLQSLKNLWEIAYEPHPVRTFQDAQRSGEREIPAQGYSPSNLFINQKHICAHCFCQQNGFPFSPMQCDWKLGRPSFLHRPNLKPGGH
jgi:hypothetical protein